VEKLEDHIYINNEGILVSITRVVLEDKVIASQSICSIQLDREEVRPPFVMFTIGVLGMMVGIFSRYNELGWFIGVTFILIGMAIWFSDSKNRQDAVIIELASGSKEYINSTEVDDLQEVYDTLNNVLIFRG
jgi:hypothetical protein